MGHDVWSLGVVLFVLLTGDFPWLKASKLDGDYRAFLNGSIMSKHPWTKLSPQVRELLTLVFAPIDRRCDVNTIRKCIEAGPLFAHADGKELRASVETLSTAMAATPRHSSAAQPRPGMSSL